MNLSEQYDVFQAEAVSCIKEDFSDHSSGRFLLVIPTGGGKTFTCIKGIAELFKHGKLKIGHDKILWVAHRIELLDQAKETFTQVMTLMALKTSQPFFLEGNVTAESTLLENKECIKLIVIDEAYRAAANTYIRLLISR